MANPVPQHAMPREEPAEIFRVLQVFLLVMLCYCYVIRKNSSSPRQMSSPVCVRQEKASGLRRDGKGLAPMTMESEKARCLNNDPLIIDVPRKTVKGRTIFVYRSSRVEKKAFPRQCYRAGSAPLSPCLRGLTKILTYQGEQRDEKQTHGSHRITGF